MEPLVQAASVQQIAKAQARPSIVERDEGVNALRAWLRKTETVVKWALEDRDNCWSGWACVLNDDADQNARGRR